MKQTSLHFGLLIMRLGVSGSMLIHGYGKASKIFVGDFSFGDPIGIGPYASLILCAFAEFIAPIFIILGWKTRWFSTVASINMIVAAFIAHAGDPFAKREKAILFLIIFTFLCFSGSGKYSLDKQ